MTIQNIKRFNKREKIYKRTACEHDTKIIMSVGCCGTACWYHCEELCELWEQKHKKHWGMHDDYNNNVPYQKISRKNANSC